MIRVKNIGLYEKDSYFKEVIKKWKTDLKRDLVSC